MKKKNWLIGVIMIVSGCHIIGTVPLHAAEEVRTLALFDFEGDFDVRKVETNNAELVLSEGGRLRVKIGKENRPSITMKAPQGHWDLSQFLYVALDVHNPGKEAVAVRCLVDNNGWVDGSVTVGPGQSRTLKVLLMRNSPPDSVKKHLFGMNGLPGGYVWIWEPIDMRKVSGLFIRIPETKAGQIIEIDNIRATGLYNPPSEKELKSSFFPFIDTFGQYIHKDWPGKTHSVKEMAHYRKEEAVDLVGHPGPAEWNQYGGWAAGPKLKVTGHFRAEKYQDKWWLVDPEGRLFWSHGVTCVRSHNATPISDREHYFAELPGEDSPLAKFYGTSKWAAHGYYKGRTPYKTYDFSQANLFRKCGEDWRQKFSNITHRRLRSWGVNTIANWSDPAIYLERKTVYTATLGTGGGRAIEGAKGHWRKFPDPFDVGFRVGLRERLAKEKGKTTDDAWCIGYFVDNELTWRDETYLALGALASGPEQPAKKVLVDELKSKYKTIEKLNAAWWSKYGSWDELLGSCKEPDDKKAHADLAKFNIKIARKYFSTIRDVIKKEAPEKLYLGCRFDFHFYPEGQKELEWVLRIAAEYCDVVSFNRYRFSANTLRLPDSIDKPVIIGEWHMGALDRGMFHTGLRSVASQGERGEAYRNYVLGGLENPYLVGTHWFQYKDQATTGRGDGENYQIGFVDICDTPYPETVEASRKVGYNLYEYRLKSK